MQKVKKFKLGKRLGADIFDKCGTQKFAISEARAGKIRRGRRGNISEFGRQLLQKQKVRFAYGITERQLSRYATEAGKTKDPAHTMNTVLESRLDNVVYRAGLAASRREARQMVSHGHLMVNNKKIRVPSHRVSVGDVLSVREGSKNHGTIAAHAKSETRPAAPAWLTVDLSKLEAKIAQEPQYDRTSSTFDFPAIFEFYSR